MEALRETEGMAAKSKKHEQTGGVWSLKQFKYRMLFEPKLNVIDIGKYFFLKI